eukprot:TRINITY_DN7800_c0_g2_i1.p1 TRINITY_DN7800_c0_g2~~TRINITY_DN7800_c0_g2_i1.p1  ORF type:complete len:200 (+),score=64.75 TRINITY_DN7800_c0_g2_i1:89-688(+)
MLRSLVGSEMCIRDRTCEDLVKLFDALDYLGEARLDKDRLLEVICRVVEYDEKVDPVVEWIEGLEHLDRVERTAFVEEVCEILEQPVTHDKTVFSFNQTLDLTLQPASSAEASPNPHPHPNQVQASLTKIKHASSPVFANVVKQAQEAAGSPQQPTTAKQLIGDPGQAADEADEDQSSPRRLPGAVSYTHLTLPTKRIV